MKYTQPSFSVPPADLRKGTNRHGQTWEDIFSTPRLSVRDSAHLALSPSHWTDGEAPEKSGHTCHGTYKTFAAVHCPYCWAEHEHVAMSDATGYVDNLRERAEHD